MHACLVESGSDRAVDGLLAPEEGAGPESEARAGSESALDAGPGDAVVFGFLIEVPAVRALVEKNESVLARRGRNTHRTDCSPLSSGDAPLYGCG